MENPELLASLILPDIATAMLDYVSLQPDIDPTKIRAAHLLAQNIDLKRIIGRDNITRCVGEDVSGADLELKELLTPAICYFTYSRLLKMFQGTFTDAGYHIDKESTDSKVALAEANEAAAVAEAFMEEALSFIEKEDGDVKDPNVDRSKMTPRIRAFGGKERRASN